MLQAHEGQKEALGPLELELCEPPRGMQRPKPRSCGRALRHLRAPFNLREMCVLFLSMCTCMRGLQRPGEVIRSPRARVRKAVSTGYGGWGPNSGFLKSSMHTQTQVLRL